MHQKCYIETSDGQNNHHTPHTAAAIAIPIPLVMAIKAKQE